MKTKRHRNSKLKHTLFQMKKAKKRNPIWNLNPLQVSMIESWGFPVYPHLYRIFAKAIPDVKNKSGLLKEVHSTYVKEKKKYVTKTLTEREKLLLRKHKVYFEPIKYEIDLQGYRGN